MGLQRPSSNKGPLHEARRGRIFRADVEGELGGVPERIFRGELIVIVVQKPQENSCISVVRGY